MSPAGPTRASCRYAAYYCEENVWQLAQNAELASSPCWAVFISNPGKACALFGQRSAPSEAEPVIWDYHVLLVSRDDAGARWVWDLDSTLPFPSALDAYIRRAWPEGRVPGRLAPRFRVIEADEYVARFASDRSHMKDAKGRWRAPPPTWAPIGRGHTLDQWVDTVRAGLGQVGDLAWLASGAPFNT